MAVIGRGIAGFSLCRELLEQGRTSLAVVGPDIPAAGSATLAAQGVSAIKGLVFPQEPLFAAKLAGHRHLIGWLSSLARESGCGIPLFKGSVGEVFRDLPAFQRQLDRAYHRRFSGVFGAEFGEWRHPSGRYFGLRHPEDFWFDPAATLAALEALILSQSHRVIAVPRMVTHVTLASNGVCELWSDGQRFLLAEKVVVAAGSASPGLISRWSANHKFQWRYSAGETFVARNDHDPSMVFAACGKPAIALDASLTLIQGTQSLTWQQGGRWVLGSTAREWHFGESRAHGYEGNLMSEVLQILNFPTSEAREDALWRPRWGVRLRARDRRPVCGTLANTQRRIWIFTGFYKNGLQLAPFFAVPMAKVIETNDETVIDRYFLASRFG